MKDILKSSFLLGILLGTGIGVYNGIIRNSLIDGIMLGSFIGILSGLASSVFLFFVNRNTKEGIKRITGNENIILDGLANHFKGREGVGGHLYLTKREIIFKSHNSNIQVHQTVIPLNQIIKVKTALTRVLVPNGLHIITQNGVEKFVVNNRKHWVRKINDAMLSKRKES